MSRLKLLSASVVLALGVGMSGTAWAHQGPAPTDVLIEFDPVSPVVEGTMVDVKGKTLCDGIVTVRRP